MLYRDYIKSELWEERKRRYYRDHPRVCAVCGYPAIELHHLNYANLGNEKDKDLAPLCRLHHQGLHEYASVRKNSYYQSRAYIESEREKYQGADIVVPVTAAKENWFASLLRGLFG